MSRLHNVLGCLRPYRRPLVIASVLTGVLTLIGMAPPLLMRSLINRVARDNEWGLFPLLMGGMLAVPLLRALVNIFNSILLNTIGIGIISDLRKGLFSKLMRLPIGFYNQTPAGAIHQRLFGDVGNISGLAGGNLVALLGDAMMVAFSVVVMLKLSWMLSLLTFALLPLYYVNSRYFSRRIQDASVQLRSRIDHISSMLQERLSAHELIQAYGQDRREATQFSSRAKQVMDAAVQGQAYSITFNQLADFLNRLGNSVIYCAGCYLYVKGRLSYGDVVAFAAYSTQLLGPVVRFAQMANQFVQIGVSVDRINEIRHREPEVREHAGARAVTALRGDIVVEGVTFGYEPGRPVLRDLHMEVASGTNVAIVGAPGAGRTTLAMLLRRFYDPLSGRVSVDGRDVREFRLGDYRRALALVMPESAIFDGTIRENLCYGKPDAAEPRMIEVAKAVGLHDFVASLARGYDTRLGTGGLRVSVGTRQQIGVARVLIADPAILIVDEATAALDPETDEQVHQAICRIMQGRTCIFIVHRLQMARTADRILVLHEGRLHEAGSHLQLLHTAGTLYRTLYAQQYGHDLLPAIREGRP
ncbi:MAG: ABC transporter ATP-binding protein [Planctomycetes bacterium]|nr:ABC transporter ATP-binding protein [Planctomycetota bacterium]